MLTDRRTLPATTLRALVWLALCGELAGCSIAYLSQATQGQWRLMRARRPIDRVLADPDTPAELRRRLELVLDAREFASGALALPNNRSYRSYADLNRPYVVWNVVAAPEFSIHPRQWCFPFTGCLSYRGYFREAGARAFAARLAARGDDVVVYGVAAYSTLGHFADPVLNTMMRYGDLELVSTIFHELAHQLVYVRGDSEFNESFAVTVEREGLRRWLAARGRSDELRAFRAQRAADRDFTRVLSGARAALDRLYQEPLQPQPMRELKRHILDTAGREVRALEERSGLRSGFDAWIDAGLNNAHLASIATYRGCVAGFQGLLGRERDDLPAFYAAVRKLAPHPAARRELCRTSAADPATAESTP